MEPEIPIHINNFLLPLLILSQINTVQVPHPNSLRPILMLTSYLRLGLPSGLFPSVFPTKTLYKTRLSPIRAIYPAHIIFLISITRKILGEENRS